MLQEYIFTFVKFLDRRKILIFDKMLQSRCLNVSSTLKVTGVLYKSSERNSLVLYLGGENESSLLSEQE